MLSDHRPNTIVKILEIDLAGREDDLDFEQDGTLFEIHPGVQVGRVRVALRALDRLTGAGETTDLHLEVESLQVEHALARLGE